MTWFAGGPGPEGARSQGSLVLASASPRRRAILESLGIPFVAFVPQIDEAPLAGESPDQLTRRLALAKARAGAEQTAGVVALGADTVVVVDSQILGKPGSPAEARSMLRALRGRDHLVITAVAAAARASRGRFPMAVSSRVAVARVWMRRYEDAEIDAYVERREPFDKAGAYAVQDEMFHPAERVESCYLTVVGLPVPQLCAVLVEIGFTGPLPSPQALPRACAACGSLDSDSWSCLKRTVAAVPLSR